MSAISNKFTMPLPPSPNADLHARVMNCVEMRLLFQRIRDMADELGLKVDFSVNVQMTTAPKGKAHG